LASDPLVKAAIETAWKNSTANPEHLQENGFFILRDPQTGAVSVQWASTGFAGAMHLGDPPASAIASFHTHPNPACAPVIFQGR
jgi:Cu/Zn superoxide dismutase